MAILLVGGLWAQLSKDPIGPEFGDFVVEAEEEIFFEDDAPAIPVPLTTVVEPTTTEADDPSTTEAENTTTVTEP